MVRKLKRLVVPKQLLFRKSNRDRAQQNSYAQIYEFDGPSEARSRWGVSHWEDSSAGVARDRFEFPLLMALRFLILIVIIALNGWAIDDPSQFLRLVSDAKPGTAATVKALRNGRTLEFKLPIVSSSTARSRR